MTYDSWCSRATAYSPDPTATADWELVPAWFDAGQWLARYDGDQLLVFAPPGVGITGSSEEPAELWQCGRWRIADEPPELIDVSGTCRLDEVLSIVPSDFAPWAIAVTAEQIERLDWYSNGARDPFVQAAQQALDLLRRELAAVNPRRRKAGAKRSAPDREALAFAALTDLEFSQLVSRLFHANWNIKTEVMHSQMGCDVLLGVAEDQRHVIEVRHPPGPSAAPAVPGAGWPNDDAIDAYWVVASAEDEADLRTQRCVAETRFLGGQQLMGMITAHPAVLDHHVKYKLAYGAQPSEYAPAYSDPAGLSGIVETRSLQEARAQYREAGIVVVSGGLGMGKSTVLNLLATEAILDGYSVERVATTDRLRTGTDRRAFVLDDVHHPDDLRRLVSTARSMSDVVVLAATADRAVAEMSGYQVHLPACSLAERAAILYGRVWTWLAHNPWSALTVSLEEVWQRLTKGEKFTPRSAEALVQWVAPMEQPGPGRPTREAPAGTEGTELLQRLRGCSRDAVLP